MSSDGTKLTLSQQAYLETIYSLSRKHEHAHTKAIAEKMGISMPSVTGALKSLAEKGLVNYQARKAITLTRKGMKFAVELEDKHSVLADFFYNILGCTRQRSEEIACRVEHVIDERFRHRLNEFVSFLQRKSPDGAASPVQEFKRYYKRRQKKNASDIS